VAVNGMDLDLGCLNLDAERVVVVMGRSWKWKRVVERNLVLCRLTCWVWRYGWE